VLLVNRDRMTISIILGSIIYALVMIIILVLIAIYDSGPDHKMVYVNLTSETRVMRLPQEASQSSGSSEKQAENTATRAEQQPRAAEQQSSSSAPAQAEQRSQESSSSSSAEASSSVSSQSSSTASTSTFTSRDNSGSFTSRSANESDMVFPDFPEETQSLEDFDWDFSQTYHGTEEVIRSSGSSADSSVSVVSESVDSPVVSNTASTGSSGRSTQGLGSSVGVSSTFSSNSGTGTSSVVADTSSTGTSGVTVTETTGTGTDTGLSGTAGTFTSRSSTGSDSGSSNEGESVTVTDADGNTWKWDGRERRIQNGANPEDLLDELKKHRDKLPPEREIHISFTVTAQGSITNLKLLTTLGYSEVESAVLNWMRGFRFTPIFGNNSVTGTIIIKLDVD